MRVHEIQTNESRGSSKFLVSVITIQACTSEIVSKKEKAMNVYTSFLLLNRLLDIFAIIKY